MTDMTTQKPDEDVAVWMKKVFLSQKAAFNAAPFPDAAQRRAQLRALKSQLRRYQDVLVRTMSEDYGFRSAFESKMLDLLGSTLELNHLISHVGKWMKPSKRSPELLFFSNSLEVTYQPKGVVGVIVPWNFPIYLAVGPLAVALAAGNRAIVKMPEATPATSRVFARLIGEIFAEDEVAVIDRPLPDPNAFTALPFDHIVFTGSSAVGKIVMRTAAENLTPVTLELGGKSPAIVSANYPIDDAARRIVHGKSANCGQVCVAPDYALAPRDRVDAFVAAAQDSFTRAFGQEVTASPDYTSVANDRQFARALSLLEDARAKGARITPCAPYDASKDGRRMPLHIVTHCRPEMLIMREELFGPILPVIPYDTLDEAIDFVNAGERPLALYLFSHDEAERREVLTRTHSGGVTINDWGWHVVNHDAPFGGVGNSGMGTYHGEEGFRALSHAKSVFTRHRFFPTQLFHPPYGNPIQKLTLRFFLGKADAGLN